MRLNAQVDVDETRLYCSYLRGGWSGVCEVNEDGTQYRHFMEWPWPHAHAPGWVTFRAEFGLADLLAHHRWRPNVPDALQVCEGL